MAWANSTGDRLYTRLERMGGQLASWSKDKFGKLGDQIAKIEKKLHIMQQNPISDENCVECADLEKTLDDLNEKQEAYLYLRSRVFEVRVGDRNTKYFHRKASQR